MSGVPGGLSPMVSKSPHSTRSARPSRRTSSGSQWASKRPVAPAYTPTPVRHSYGFALHHLLAYNSQSMTKGRNLLLLVVREPRSRHAYTTSRPSPSAHTALPSPHPHISPRPWLPLPVYTLSPPRAPKAPAGRESTLLTPLTNFYNASCQDREKRLLQRLRCSLPPCDWLPQQEYALFPPLIGSL
eukprot:521446-Pyramimonas_sp.AAC.1